MKPAGPFRRLFAWTYDLLPLVALVLLINAASVSLNGGLATQGIIARSLTFALMVGVVSGYFALSWRRGGQTLGMRAWKLILRRHDGAAPSWRECWIRSGVAWITLPLAPLDWVSAWGGRRSLVERMLNTEVLYDANLGEARQSLY